MAQRTRRRHHSPATVMGKMGTLYFTLDSLTGAGGGNWVIIGGTGDLAGLHGRGTTAPGGGESR